jgi:hypothetical protein
VEFVEVDQKPELERHESQIIPSCLFEEIADLGNGLQLDENKIVDDEVGAEGDFFQEFAIVEDGDRFLTFDEMAHLAQLSRDGGFVDGFEETGSELGVHFECGVENGFTDDFLVHRVWGWILSREGSEGKAENPRRGVGSDFVSFVFFARQTQWFQTSTSIGVGL